MALQETDMKKWRVMLDTYQEVEADSEQEAKDRMTDWLIDRLLDNDAGLVAEETP